MADPTFAPDTGTGQSSPMHEDERLYRDRMLAAQKAELGAASNFYRGNPQGYAGQQQMAADQSRAVQAGMAQQIGRGSSAMAARGGIYGAARGQQGAIEQGSQKVQQERLGRDQAMLAAMDRQAQYRQMMRDDQTRRYLGDLQYQQAKYERERQEQIAEREADAATAGAVISGIGGFMGGMFKSDERLKVIGRTGHG